jgi:hypothetical protein
MLTKEDIYPILEKYYESIGRLNPPQYKTYSLKELKRCLVLFKLHIEK